MKIPKTLKGLLKEAKGVNFGVAGDTILSAKAVIFIAHQQEETNKLLRKLTNTPTYKVKRWWEFWR